MRKIRDRQMKFGGVNIEDIELDHKCRDDLPVLLQGIQHLYKNEKFRNGLFAILEEKILPKVNKKVGRPGMEVWRIFMMGMVKQGTGCDFDHLHDMVNQHTALREFLGHVKVWDKYQYNYQTMVDNVNLLSPEILDEINALIVEVGHEVAGKKFGELLRGRCDSFVAETNVHYPTDVNLLWDAMRSLIRVTSKAARGRGVSGWRQWKHLTQRIKDLFQDVRRANRARPQRVEEYLGRCEEVVKRAEKTLPYLVAKREKVKTINRIKEDVEHAKRQIDQVNRRVLQGEKIPHSEKVFSIFEPHTRWISKGKAGCPVELGVPVCILEDHFGFILHHEVMWEGSDVDYAVKMVKRGQELFPSLRAVSFDRGFHSPQNRIKLDELLEHNVLPKKGRSNKADLERERGEEFVAMRRKHSAVESAINNLEHRGLDRVRARGADGFARTVSLSIAAFNIHRIGLLLRRRKRRRHAA